MSRLRFGITLYRPHGYTAAGALVIAAGVYEFTPLKQNCRRRCRESVRFRTMEAGPEDAGKEGPLAEWAASTGTDWPTYARETPGMSAFAREDGAVYHTYSAYARGVDALWGMYQWLDRAPRGRNETRTDDAPLAWFRRHDEYDRE
jgi:predicted dithiol-disulfide oxidoreductase (DUF899 family)